MSRALHVFSVFAFHIVFVFEAVQVCCQMGCAQCHRNHGHPTSRSCSSMPSSTLRVAGLRTSALLRGASGRGAQATDASLTQMAAMVPGPELQHRVIRVVADRPTELECYDESPRLKSWKGLTRCLVGASEPMSRFGALRITHWMRRIGLLRKSA